MKKKELKNIAKKIAKAEHTIQTSSDSKAVKEAQEEILKLSGHVTSLEDITLIDEYVQDILSQLS